MSPKTRQLNLEKRAAMPAPVQPNASSWEVRSRSTHCAATGEAFADGQPIMSRLVDAEGESNSRREDYALGAWTKELHDASTYCWKTVFKLPPPRVQEAFKPENAEEALRELLELRDPGLANTLFILAVMLERKRLLVEQGAQRDAEGRLMRIYEHKDTAETFFIHDPELALDRIAEVQQEVALRLGWIAPPAAPTPEAEAPEETKISESER